MIFLTHSVSKRSGVAALTTAAVLAAGAAWAPVAEAALPAGCVSNHDATVTCSYADTGSEQQFAVPVGVTALSVKAVGAPGGQSLQSPFAASGGRGAVVQSVIGSTPGQTLYVEVGGPPSGSTGGYNGGANGGAVAGGGGGASDIRTCSVTATSCSGADNTLDSRLVVAGGGGGGATIGDGSASGSTGGDAGPTASAGANGIGGAAADGMGGGGGTSTSGGSAGQGAGAIVLAQSGTAGSGGAGGNDPDGQSHVPLGGGGGGGGGYFGGGGGGGADVSVVVRPNGYSIVPAAAGGGGAGSSYTVPTNSGGIGTAMLGQLPSVSITYTPSVPSISSISPATLGSGATGIAATVTGSNLDSPIKAKFSSSGIVGTIKSSSPTAVNLTITVKQGTPAGRYNVTVTGADGQAATCTGCLTVVTGPSIQSFAPTTLSPGHRTPFTVTGSGFTSDATLVGPTGVSFSALKVSSDGTTITGTVTVAKSTPAGTGRILWIKDGALGNYGSDKVGCLNVPS